MRNSTKKITAIAAALLLSVSGVATTAAMAAPAVFADDNIAAPGTVTSDLQTTVADVTLATDLFSSNADNYELDNGTYGILDSTYNFGKALTPVEDFLDTEGNALYVYDSKNTKYYKLESKAITDISYTKNTDAGTDTATVTITIDGNAVNGDDTIDVTGIYTTTFSIDQYDLNAKNTVKLDNVVTAAWNGSQPIVINPSDFKLYTEETAADGKSKYNSYINTSLYTISKVNAVAAVFNDDDLVEYTPTIDSSTNFTSGTPVSVSFDDADSDTDNFAEGTCSAALVITRADWNNVTVEAKNQVSAKAANVTVTLNGYALDSDLAGTTTNASLTTAATSFTGALAGKAYAVYTNEVEDGLVKVVVTPNAAFFENAKAYTTYVSIGKNISSNITNVYYTDRTNATYTYTGSEIKPAVTVVAKSGVTLTEGVDYEIVYKNNVNKGSSATATIKGIGDYAGEKAVPGTFTITAKKLSETTVTAEDVTYETTLPTVETLAKALTVKNGDTTLVYGKDFTVEAYGNIKEGENTLRILPVDGNDNYTGSKTATVNVVKVENLSTAEIATIANVAYTGEAQTPALTVTLGDKELVEGTDYTVEYTNNTEVGCATATITGIGAYTGTNERNFVVVPQKVTGLKAVKKTATTLKLQFNAVEGADGYKIYDAETGKAIASVSTQNGADVLKKTITGLNAGETRKYKVRAYKIVNGTKRYAEYSAVYTKATAKK